MYLSDRERDALHTSVRKLFRSFHIVKAVRVFLERMRALYYKKNREKSRRLKKQIGHKGKLCVYNTYPPTEIGWEGDKYINYTKKIKSKIENALRMDDDIYVIAYQGFLNDDRDFDYSKLKFKKEYRDEAEKILGDNMSQGGTRIPKGLLRSCFGDKGCLGTQRQGKTKELWYNSSIIGVHVRRTDHETCIKYSTLDSFVERMKEAVNEDDKTVFFLATDDDGVERQLNELFPGRIIVNGSKAWGRDSVEGMKSGIVDMLCLSMCRYILGSYTSTFSHFASRYGGKKLEICMKKVLERDIDNTYNT